MMLLLSLKTLVVVVFFNDTATTEIYTLSLHDALPISPRGRGRDRGRVALAAARARARRARRSEEHTSELQSRQYLVCRLLLEKKKDTLIVHLHLMHRNGSYVPTFDTQIVVHYFRIHLE